MASLDPLQQVFDTAKREFEQVLPSNTPVRDILATTSIDMVWEAMDKLQADQAKRNHLRHLSRIRPFLERLRSFAVFVDICIQVKPEVMALIWGPIRLLLVWTSEWEQGFDAVVKTMERIGDILPQFQDIAELFIDKDKIKDVLGLFYRDILDFYLETLKFFSLSRRKIIFETLWPKRKERLKIVETSIERHARLLRENITFEHISREHEARARSLEEFQESEAFRAKQHFDTLTAAISPQMYDDRLEWLRRRICPGTATWLEGNQAFCQWLDTGPQSTSLLWLQGIPGAGKTFLACRVVDEAKAKCRTVFAFPTHLHTNTTAISLIHSLLFQLASNDSDLQAVLVNSNKRELTSKTDFAKDILKNAFKCVGRVFVVVDGLDEVDEFERTQFLNCLLEALKDCKDSGLKICISSRAEDNIAKMLNSTATIIRVDNYNAPGVQNYVQSRYNQWMADTNFLTEGQSEIKALLSRIWTKARGMFLYARIVIDNVIDLTSMDDIRRELRALPEDLDDVYERVLSRINRLPSSRRDRVKRILGWIGCSPTPMNQYELEQALLVGTNIYDDAPVVDSSLNLIKLCGPIVEVVEHTPQFVHFTVKEYIFNRQNDFVSESESTMDLLVSCLTYLSYNALGEDVPVDELKDNLVSGKYRLQVFASSTWFALTKKYVKMRRDKESLGVINELMESLFSERENSKFKPDVDGETGSNRMPRTASLSIWPQAPGFLSHTLQFYKDHPKDLWTSNNAETWAYLDPLTVSNCSARVEVLYDDLLCRRKVDEDRAASNSAEMATTIHKDDCVCPKLERHYGKRLYKCHFFQCPFRRDGFETDKDCGDHMANHSRPWKCSVKSCDFSIIGFQSHDRLRKHRDRLHRVVRESAFTNPAASDDEALYPLLYGLVAAGDIEELESIWSSCRQKVEPFTEYELTLMAAGQGSLPMVQLFLRWDDGKQKPQNDAAKFHMVIHDALQSGNLDLAGWILDRAMAWGRGVHGRYREVVVAVLKSDSAAIFDLWLRSVEAMDDYSPTVAQELFEKTVLNTAARFPDQGVRMVESWRRLVDLDRIRRPDLGRALVMVAQSTLSIEHAAVLLELGAPIDYPRPESDKGFTALRWASKRTSEEAANFMKFLLLEGASPKAVSMKLEQGAQKIDTWLHMSWEELVEWVRQERASQKSLSTGA